VGVAAAVAVTTATSSRVSWAAALGTLWLVAGLTTTVAERFVHRWQAYVVSALCVVAGIVLVTVVAPGAFLWWDASRWWGQLLLAGSWYVAGWVIGVEICQGR